jgi:hypothetical protein
MAKSVLSNVALRGAIDKCVKDIEDCEVIRESYPDLYQMAKSGLEAQYFELCAEEKKRHNEYLETQYFELCAEEEKRHDEYLENMASFASSLS